MTSLVVYDAANPAQILARTSDFAEISAAIAALGARFERWSATRPVSDDALADDILAAYKGDIDKLKSERGYQSADVVSIRPGNPGWPALREKFLSEHTHDEDEVRFFVEGSGAFYLHIDDKVYQVICEKDDLLSVPHGVRHWFDGGKSGNFTCIRLFTRPDGWAAAFTGDRISQAWPAYGAAA